MKCIRVALINQWHTECYSTCNWSNIEKTFSKVCYFDIVYNEIGQHLTGKFPNSYYDVMNIMLYYVTLLCLIVTIIIIREFPNFVFQINTKENVNYKFLVTSISRFAPRLFLSYSLLNIWVHCSQINNT